MLKVLGNWISAFRLKTLPAALSPVFIGAIISKSVHIPTLIIICITALLIQIGTNLANDYFDYKNGADTEARLGPVRATSAGLISPQAMKWGVIITFASAFVLGLSLVARGGLPILIIGIASIISGILYTGGPYPLGYNGLGDIFVLLFFGPVAVGGTTFLLSGEFSREILIIGLSPGLLSMAILAVNNLRDQAEDKKTGKRTLAVLIGTDFAKWEYLLSCVVAVSIPLIVSIKSNTFEPKQLLLLLNLLPVAFLTKIVWTQQGEILNKVLAGTGKVMIIFTVLFYLSYRLL